MLRVFAKFRHASKAKNKQTEDRPVFISSGQKIHHALGPGQSSQGTWISCSFGSRWSWWVVLITLQSQETVGLQSSILMSLLSGLGKMNSFQFLCTEQNCLFPSIVPLGRSNPSHCFEYKGLWVQAVISPVEGAGNSKSERYDI